MGLVVLLTGAFSSADAQNTWTSGECTVTLSDGILTVSKAKGSGRMFDYTEENSYYEDDDYYKTEPLIPDPEWMELWQEITAIVVNEGVTHIGGRAFEGLDYATSVTIPEGLVSIGKSAFVGCGRIPEITFPSTLTYIGDDAFYLCHPGLHDIYCYADPANLTWIDNDGNDFLLIGTKSTCCHVNAADEAAFKEKFPGVNVSFWGDLDFKDNEWHTGDCFAVLDDDGTLTITKTGGEGRMGDYAVYGNYPPWNPYDEKIKSVVIGEGVINVGSAAFYNCLNLTKASLPSTVTTIGDYAFKGCTNLKEVNMSESVTYIGGSAFGECSSLQEVDLPEGITTIEYGAFVGCIGLTTLTIPSTVTYIGNYVFWGCTSVTDVYCYADPINLEWWSTSNRFDFKSDNATLCHVRNGSLTAYKQLHSSVDVTFVGDQPDEEPGLAIDATNFPDDNFRQRVHDLPENNGDDYLSDVELRSVKTISVGVAGITDLTGIGLFTELTTLYCNSNQLTSLDLSKNPKLTFVNCTYNQLTSIDLSKNVELKGLDCSQNQLTSLDLSKNLQLTFLDCASNQLTSLDLSNNLKLKSLEIQFNQIKDGEMNAMVASLHDDGGSLYAYTLYDREGNKMTKDQRLAAEAKNWVVFFMSTNGEWMTNDDIAYSVWVGGVQVTEKNINDVLGDGSVKYESGDGTGTLTFASGKTVIDGDYDGAKIWANGIDLTINAPEGLIVENTTNSGIRLDIGLGQNPRKLTINGDVTFNTKLSPVEYCSDLVINGNLTATLHDLSILVDNITINGNTNITGNENCLAARSSLVLNGDRHEFHCTGSGICIISYGTLSITGDLTATTENYTVIRATDDITLVSGSWTLDGGNGAAVRSEKGNIIIPSTHEIIIPARGEVGVSNYYNCQAIVDRLGYDAKRVVLIDTSSKICVYDDADNSEKLEARDGETLDVLLNRTLKKAQLNVDSWNTFASPVNITDLEDTFGQGMKVKRLVRSILAGGTLRLIFVDAQQIEAGKPYLVKVPADVDLMKHAFENVTVSKDIVPTVTNHVDFIPTLGKTTIEGDRESVLFLVSRNRLAHPSMLPEDMKGFRAYFRLKNPAAVRSIDMNLDDDEITGIVEIENSELVNSKYHEAWYTLDGRKLIGQPTAKGIYINKGKKTIIK